MRILKFIIGCILIAIPAIFIVAFPSNSDIIITLHIIACVFIAIIISGIMLLMMWFGFKLIEEK